MISYRAINTYSSPWLKYLKQWINYNLLLRISCRTRSLKPHPILEVLPLSSPNATSVVPRIRQQREAQTQESRQRKTSFRVTHSLALRGFPWSSAGKGPSCNVGDLASIPGLRRSLEEGNGYPLQNSGQENFTDCIIHGVTKSRTWLRDSLHFTALIIYTWN